MITYKCSDNQIPDKIANLEEPIDDYCPNCEDGIMVAGLCNSCGYPGCNGKYD